MRRPCFVPCLLIIYQRAPGYVKVFSTRTANMDFREATDLLGMPLDQIAEATGRTYGTILAYRRGDRQAPPDVMATIARLMKVRASDLALAASRVDPASLQT